MSISLKLVLTNIGNTPAFDVEPHIRAYLRTQARFDERAEQMKVAEDVKSRRPSRFGYTIFPGQPVPVEWGVSISNAEIEAAHAEHGEGFTYVEPFIVGAISYTFSLSDKPHQTGIIRQLVRPNPPNPRAPISINTAEGELPASQLALYETLAGSPYVD